MSKTGDNYLNMTENDIDKLYLLDIVLDEEKKTNKSLCISCKNNHLIIDLSKGHKVCSDCGVVQNEHFSDNLEFSNDISGTSSYGCPTSYYYPKSGLGTKMKTRGWSRISALQKQQQMPYKEKSLMQVLNVRIQNKCKSYKITQKIIDRAKSLYKKISDCKHTKGTRKGKSMIMRCINRKSMIAACVFYACKLENEPRSPKEIADIYELEIKNVNRGCRKFLDYIDFNKEIIEFKSSQSSDFIERFAKKLGVKSDLVTKAKDISKNIHKLDIASTHEPPSVAAGCLLLVTELYHIDLTKKQISDVFRISDVTISKTFRRIKPYYKIIMNNKITQIIVDKLSNRPKNKLNLTKDNLVTVKKVDYLSESDESLSDSDLNSDNETNTTKKKITV